LNEGQQAKRLSHLFQNVFPEASLAMAQLAIPISIGGNHAVSA
jgi:hypothetical protein